MDEIKKYHNAKFNFKNIRNRGNCLLVYLSDELAYGSPEIEVYSSKDGIYLGKVSKLSVLNSSNPDLIYNWNNNLIGFYIRNRVELKSGNGLDITDFKDPFDFLMHQYKVQTDERNYQ